MPDAAAWLGAGGTLGAVVLALFPQVRHVAWRPRLVITHDEASFNVRRDSAGDYVRHGYARIGVRARRNQPGAEGLEVSLLRCRPPARLDRRDELAQEEFRVALRWAYVHAPTITLHAGAVRYVDVLELCGDDPSAARLALQRGPEEGYYLMAGPPRYVLEIEFAGTNFDAEVCYVVVEHTGDWNPASEPFEAAMRVSLELDPPTEFQEPRSTACRPRESTTPPPA